MITDYFTRNFGMSTMLTNWQPAPVRNGELTMQEYILQGMIAADIDMLDNNLATLQQDLTNCRFDIANQEQMNALQAANIDMLGLMKGCEQAPEFIKEEDLKPDGFPITD